MLAKIPSAPPVTDVTVTSRLFAVLSFCANMPRSPVPVTASVAVSERSPVPLLRPMQPSMIALIRDVVGQLKAAGVAVVLVEQRPDAVLQMADQISFMANGTVAETVAAAGLTTGSAQFQTYVGV